MAKQFERAKTVNLHRAAKCRGTINVKIQLPNPHTEFQMKTLGAMHMNMGDYLEFEKAFRAGYVSLGYKVTTSGSTLMRVKKET